MKSSRTHRGKLLERVAKEHDLSITRIVKKAGFSRTTFYENHIKQPDLPFEVLQQYGTVMHHDFAYDLPEYKDGLQLQEGPPPEYLTVDQVLKDLNELRTKYFALLEKYNSLLEEKAVKKSKR